MRPRSRGVLVAGIVAAVVAGGFALYWFAPWNLVVDRRVDEALPSAGAAVTGSTGAASTADEQAATGATAPAAATGSTGSEGPTRLSSGAFASLEHETRGRAVVVELADGSRFVRLEDLETSNGPDLRVILSSEAPQEDWHVYDDGALVDLGALKGNLGSSNYAIPANVDLERFASVVVWCRRFSVGFGVAPLELAAS